MDNNAIMMQMMQMMMQMMQMMQQPNPNPVQLSAQPSAQTIAQSNAAAIEVMNNSTEVADLKAQIANLKAQLSETQAQLSAEQQKSSELSKQLSALNAKNESFQQEKKMAETYLGQDWGSFLENIEENAGDELYKQHEIEWKTAGYTGPEMHDMIKASVEDINQIRNYGSLNVDMETGKEISQAELVKTEIDRKKQQQKEKEKQEYENGAKKKFDGFGAKNVSFS